MSRGWHKSDLTKFCREYTVLVPIFPEIDGGSEQFNSIYIDIPNDLYDCMIWGKLRHIYIPLTGYAFISLPIN